MTTDVERFPEKRQRLALKAFQKERGEFLNTAEGFAFLEQLGEFFAPGGVAVSRRRGYFLEPDEVVNMIVAQLLEPKSSALAGAIAARMPWNYLGACVQNWVQAEHGHRGVPLEVAEWQPYSVFDEPESYETGLEEAALLTYRVLEPRTPERLRVDVMELLRFAAANPPQRLSYEHFEREAAKRYAPLLTEYQIRTVLNLAWGGRPDRSKTSLFGQFMRNPDFRLVDSKSHSRAVQAYKQVMRISPETALIWEESNI